MMGLLFGLTVALLFRDRIVDWIDDVTFPKRARFIIHGFTKFWPEKDFQLKDNFTKTVINPRLANLASLVKSYYDEERVLLSQIKSGRIDYPDSKKELSALREVLESERNYFYRVLKAVHHFGYAHRGENPVEFYAGGIEHVNSHLFPNS